MANAQNNASRAIAAAQAQAQINIANAQQQNEQAFRGAGFQQQAGMFNAGETNQRDAFIASLFQDNSQFNAGEQNRYGIAGSTLAQDNNQFNTGEGNRYNIAGTTLQQNNNQFNADAAIRSRGQDDALLTNLLGIQGGDMSREQDLMLSRDEMQLRKDLQEKGFAHDIELLEMKLTADQKKEPNWFQKYVLPALSLMANNAQTGATLIAASDSRLKVNVRPMAA
jgi:hypothetical protein